MELYNYKATVLRILDGDTIELNIDLGFTVHWKSTCRFYGINTPELKSKDAQERKRAKEARDFTSECLPIGASVIVKSKELDKYGRPLVDLYYGEDNIHLNQLLLDKKLANILNY
jgi:micrococcal nuclease